MPHTGPEEDFGWKMAEIRMAPRRCTVKMSDPSDYGFYPCHRPARTFPLEITNGPGASLGSVRIYCTFHHDIGYWNSEPIPNE